MSNLAILLAVVLASALWWAGTSLVLYLDGLPQRSHAPTMKYGFVVFVVSIFIIYLVRDETTALAAYMAFAASIVTWGYLEIVCYLGVVSGPRQGPCPEGVADWKRFKMGVETIIYHELVVLGTGLLLFGLSIGTENKTGFWAFAVLWVMRISAKVNMFLGVRNLFGHWLPAELRYLITYCRHRRMNALMPVSIFFGTLFAYLIFDDARATGINDAQIVGQYLVAALLVLAVIEHILLIVPLSLQSIWSWGYSSHNKP